MSLFVDLDRDGDPDLVEAGGGATPLRAFRNDGAGVFTSYGALLGNGETRPCTGLAAADADGDGAVDLLASFWKAPMRLLQNQGDGRFRDVSAEVGLDPMPARSLAAALVDLDGDGVAEIVTTSATTSSPASRPVDAGARLLRRDPAGRYVEVDPPLPVPPGFSCMEVAALDWDGDGLRDLLLAGGGPRFDAWSPSVLLRNRGGLRFERLDLRPAGELPLNTVAVAVLDGAKAGPPRLALLTGGLYPARGRRVLLSAGAPRTAGLRPGKRP